MVWRPYRKKEQGMYQKVLGVPYIILGGSRCEQTLVVLREKWFFRTTQKWLTYLINPVVYWQFWRPCRKKDRGTYQKALGFPYILVVVSSREETLAFIRGNCFSRGTKMNHKALDASLGSPLNSPLNFPMDPPEFSPNFPPDPPDFPLDHSRGNCFGLHV